MATTKTTKTKAVKPSTEEVVDETTPSVEDVQIKETSVKEVKPMEEKKEPKKFAPNDQIECKSITYGELLLPGKKSQLLYTWADYGDTTYVEYQDLQALRSVNSQYLKAPLFVIEDNELVEQWSELKPIYENVATLNIDDMFALPIGKFKSVISSLPNGFKEAIKNVASSKILDGSLDSITKIKAMDEILGTDLMFYIQ